MLLQGARRTFGLLHGLLERSEEFLGVEVQRLRWNIGRHIHWHKILWHLSPPFYDQS